MKMSDRYKYLPAEEMLFRFRHKKTGEEYTASFRSFTGGGWIQLGLDNTDYDYYDFEVMQINPTRKEGSDE